MWYYMQDGQRLGPISTEEAKTLISLGSLQRHTRVWKTSIEQSAKAEETELAALFNSQQPPPVPSPVFNGLPPVQQLSRTAKYLRSLWRWLLWLSIGSYLIVPAALVVIGIAYLALHANSFAYGLFVAVLGLQITAIAATIILALLILHQCWSLIQDGDAHTTPRQAIFLLFIPLYNLYWSYVTLVVLAQNTNHYTQERKIQSPRISEKLALASYLLFICLPLVGFSPIDFIFLPAVIIPGLMFFNQLVTTAQHIAEHQYRQPPALEEA